MVVPVFDILYRQYTAERLAYETKINKVSEYLSENLLYNVLCQAIADFEITNLGVLCHYPLSRLIADVSVLDDRERTFVESPFSHVDFLIYNTITKQPKMTIEVDGWQYHKGNEAQESRDVLKDEILWKYGLKPWRILTVDVIDVEVIKNKLKDISK